MVYMTNQIRCWKRQCWKKMQLSWKGSKRAETGRKHAIRIRNIQQSKELKVDTKLPKDPEQKQKRNDNK